MEFEHDVFISYTHLDNDAPFPDDPGWVSLFHQVLEKRVAQLTGRSVRIWRDPNLRGNDVFPETLKETVQRAATLVCVISPRYVESEWCKRELAEFTRAAGQVVVGGASKARVFKVVKTPLPVERHPQPVQPLLGYEFFKVDPESNRVRELDVSIDPQSKRDYWARLDDLANDIKDLLERLDEEGADPGGAPAADSRGTVYLAETTSDLRDARDDLKRDLTRHGYTVLPDRQLPLAAREFTALVVEQLERADLAIHLIGSGYGLVPEGTSRSMVDLQNELAAERATAGSLRRLIWMPPRLEPEDDRQAAFVGALRDDERSYERSDLLEVPLEDLKTHLHDHLRAIAERAARERAERQAREAGPSAAPGAGAAVRQVYLICDQQDGETVAPLEDYLFDRGFEVVLPTFEGAEAAVFADHVASLTASDAFLLYYGSGGQQWVRNQLRELQKSLGYEGKKPELATTVYVAGPPDPQKERFRTHLAEVVVEAAGVFDPASLEPFVAKVERG